MKIQQMLLNETLDNSGKNYLFSELKKMINILE